ncbi:unnamed protein product [Knipowitschia caucasica]
MGDTQSAQRDPDAAAAAEEEGRALDQSPSTAEETQTKLQNNGQISELNEKKDGTVTDGSDPDEEAVIVDKETSSVKSTTEELSSVQLIPKESPDPIQEEAIEILNIDGKQNDLNESFKKFFSNIGLKLTVKKGLEDQPEEETEGTETQEVIEETASETRYEDVDKTTDLDAIHDNDSTTGPTMTDGASDGVGEAGEENITETCGQEAHAAAAQDENQNHSTKVEQSPTNEEEEEFVSPIKKFFTTGIFAGLKKKIIEEEEEEKELIDMSKNDTDTRPVDLQEVADQSPIVTKQDIESKELEEDTAHVLETTEVEERGKTPSTDQESESEITSSQEKVQSSPFKRLFSRSTFKKHSKRQKGRRSSDDKLSDSGENTENQFVASAEKLDVQEKVEETAPSPLITEPEEELSPWEAFKKLMTPRKSLKRASVDVEEVNVQTAAEDTKPQEMERSSDHSTEDGRKRKDSTHSWEAVLCGSGRRRSRKTSDSEGEQTQEGREVESSNEAGDLVTSTPNQAGSSSDSESLTWKSFKKLMTPKRKVKDNEESKDNVQSDSEATQEETLFSIKKLLPGQKKRKSGDKQDQLSSDEGDKEVVSVEEDSETPAVVPLSEFDQSETEETVKIDVEVQESEHDLEQEHSLEIPKTFVQEVQKHQITPIIPLNTDQDELTEFSKYQPLSDIPEEGHITDTLATSFIEDIAKDDTIAEDIVELTSEAITAPEHVDITIADETDELMLSAASHLTESSKTSGNTTPVPAEPNLKDIGVLLKNVVETISTEMKAEPFISEGSSLERGTGPVTHVMLDLSANGENVNAQSDAIETMLEHHPLEAGDVQASLVSETLSEFRDANSTAFVSEVSRVEYVSANHDFDEAQHKMVVKQESVDDSDYMIESISEVAEFIKVFQEEHVFQDSSPVEPTESETVGVASAELLAEEQVGKILTEQSCRQDNPEFITPESEMPKGEIDSGKNIDKEMEVTQENKEFVGFAETAKQEAEEITDVLSLDRTPELSMKVSEQESNSQAPDEHVVTEASMEPEIVMEDFEMVNTKDLEGYQEPPPESQNFLHTVEEVAVADSIMKEDIVTDKPEHKGVNEKDIIEEQCPKIIREAVEVETPVTEAITERTTEDTTVFISESINEIYEATTETITKVTTEMITEATTEATTEMITEATTETITEATTEMITEATTETITEATTEMITEATTEMITEATTEMITEATTEMITEATTEMITEATTEMITEATTAMITEATTEMITEATTEMITEATTETITEATTEMITEATTEMITEATTEMITEATTETITEATTETITEATTEATTEMITEATTETITKATTEMITEATTEMITEATTEMITEATTEMITEATTEDFTEIETAAQVLTKIITEATHDTDTTIEATTDTEATIKATHDTEATIEATTETEATIKATHDNEATIEATTDNEATIKATTVTEANIEATTDTEATTTATHDTDTTIKATTDTTDNTIGATTDTEATIEATSDTTIVATHDTEATIKATTDTEATIKATHDTEATIVATHDTEATIKVTTDTEATIKVTHDTEATIEATTDTDTTIKATTDTEATIEATTDTEATIEATTDTRIHQETIQQQHDVVTEVAISQLDDTTDQIALSTAQGVVERDVVLKDELKDKLLLKSAENVTDESEMLEAIEQNVIPYKAINVLDGQVTLSSTVECENEALFHLENALQTNCGHSETYASETQVDYIHEPAKDLAFETESEICLSSSKELMHEVNVCESKTTIEGQLEEDIPCPVTEVAEGDYAALLEQSTATPQQVAATMPDLLMQKSVENREKIAEETSIPCVDNAEVLEEPIHEVQFIEVEQVGIHGEREEKIVPPKTTKTDVQHSLVAQMTTCSLKDVLSQLPDVSLETRAAVQEPMIGMNASEKVEQKAIETTTPLEEIAAHVAQEGATVVVMHASAVETGGNHQVQVQVVNLDVQSAKTSVDKALEIGFQEDKEVVDSVSETIERVDSFSATLKNEQEIATEKNEVTIQEVVQHLKEIVDSDEELEFKDLPDDMGEDQTIKEAQDEECFVVAREDPVMETKDQSFSKTEADIKDGKVQAAAPSHIGTPGNTAVAVPQNTGIISSVGNVEAPSSISLEFKLNIQFGHSLASFSPSQPTHISTEQIISSSPQSPTAASSAQTKDPAKAASMPEVGVQATAEEIKLENEPQPSEIVMMEVAVQASEAIEDLTSKNLDLKDIGTQSVEEEPVLMDVSTQYTDTSTHEEEVKPGPFAEADNQPVVMDATVQEEITEAVQPKEEVSAIQSVETLQPEVIEEKGVVETQLVVLKVSAAPMTQTEEDDENQDVWMDAEEDVGNQIKTTSTYEIEESFESQPDYFLETKTDFEESLEHLKKMALKCDVDSEGEDFAVALEDPRTVPATIEWD